jgi:uncharacterized protein
MPESSGLKSRRQTRRVSKRFCRGKADELIQNGVAPGDPRVSSIRFGCRTVTVSPPAPNANPIDAENLSAKPTFDCTKGRSLAAHVICLDQEGASADWELTSAYWARYFSLPQSDQQAFDQAQQHWLEALNGICRARAQTQRECVLSAYRKRASAYRSQLDGDALVESRLGPQQHAQIQQALVEHGFLNGTTDGEFGPNTRAAIKSFQSQSDSEATGVLTANQRQQLLGGKPRDETVSAEGELSDKASRLSSTQAASLCQSSDPESRLIGCTAIINVRGRGSSVTYSDALDGRCWAFNDLGQYARGLPDCRAASELEHVPPELTR